MIICFEGAPATGKSTLAKQLSSQGAYRIAEVNERYTRPADESRYWYTEKQFERWSDAKNLDQLAILDGDVYQPIWFNWMYSDRTGIRWEDNLRYFERHAERVGVPDHYLFLWVEEQERQNRELTRSLSQGRTHAHARSKAIKYKLMRTLAQAYFQALAEAFPGLVTISRLDDLDIELPQEKPRTQIETSILLGFMKNWLTSNTPASILEQGA